MSPRWYPPPSRPPVEILPESERVTKAIAAAFVAWWRRVRS